MSPTSTSSAINEYSQQIEIDADDWVNAVAFTANGEYLLSGGEWGVQVLRVKSGERVATMQARMGVRCIAVSKLNGGWIAAVSKGEVLIWDATTYEQVKFAHKMSSGSYAIYDVDFSPNSPCLVSADGYNKTATIWDIATQQVQTLPHSGWQVEAAKYSPGGDRIATATHDSVHIWDADDGRLLVNINVKVDPWRGLLWFGNKRLFAKTKDSKIKEFDASTASTISEWPVPDGYSSIALPQHGRFVANSTSDAITFWDTSTHTRLGIISRSSKSCSIAFSPDDQLLAIVAQGRKIMKRPLSLVRELDININKSALDAWKHDQLPNAEELLTAAIPVSKDTAHHVLASRALVRTRLHQWDAALVDAEESINIQPSVIGYIAKCAALVGKGDILAGCRVCDTAFYHFHSNHVAILLLIKAIILFMTGQHKDAISRIDDLIAIAFVDPTLYVIQAYMYLLLGNSHMGDGNYEHAIKSFERARVKLGDRSDHPPLIVSLISGWNFDDLAIMIQQRSCEALFAAGRTKEAGESVLRMVDRKINMTDWTKAWITDFTRRCLSIPENSSRALISQEMSLLRVWARFRLMVGTWEDALAATTDLMPPRSTIYQVICERLEMTGYIADAVVCFHHMYSELAQEMNGEQLNWTQGFISRCCGKLEELGDSMMNAEEYDKTILRYTTALALGPVAPQNLLVKRSKAYMRMGKWEDALNDANEVIRIDPSSPVGYERIHEASLRAGHYSDAIDAFEMMLLKISQSSDLETRKQARRYVRPEQTKETIRTTIKDTIRDYPLVLINTISGRLCNKLEQVTAFESTPVFAKLVASMTTHIDHILIEEEVGKFYRYATFSHTWEDGEPLFEQVIKIVVYTLGASRTHDKLRMFCKIVREAGFHWAWSDTCCIDKGDHFVLQEALVSMFKWYEGSAMTIIFLRGVGRLALRGALVKSIWNTRGWTLQEYHASKVVRFYTEDWTPYLGLDIYNHKDSPEIISEMEEATGISTRALTALRPGLDDVCEKLHLASTRQTTRVEDAAYSLLGIFSLSLPILYGEGDKALGKLLSQLLASSGEVGILAWTGKSGSFNSCLPASITVFSELPTTHLPSDIPEAEMQTITTGLRSLDLNLATMLYSRVIELPVPSFSGRRMKLPRLTFKLGPLSASHDGSGRVFRAQTSSLGVVVIRTGEDLSQLGSLCVVHPWIDFLLDRHPVGNVAQIAAEENKDDSSSVQGDLLSLPGPSHVTSTARRSRRARLMSRLGLPFGDHSTPDTASLLPPSSVSPMEKQTHVLEFIARLRRPFGALLLTPTRQNLDEYKRVAAGCSIRVQVEEITPAVLEKLINSVRVLDVL